MLNRFRHLGLQLVILSTFFVVLIAGMGIAVLLIPRDVEETYLTALDSRGTTFLDAVAAEATARAVREGRKDAVFTALQRTQLETLGNELAAAAVVLPDEQAPNHQDRPDFSRVFTQVGSPELALEFLKAHPALQTTTLQGGQKVKLRKISLISFEGAIKADRVVGYAVAVLSPSEVNDRVTEFRNKLLYGFALFGAVFLAVVYLVTTLLVLRPLARMRELATRIGEGDLTARVTVVGSDELGSTAEALNKITESLNITLGKVKGVSDGISSVMTHISRSSDVVARGAAASQDSVNATSSSMEQMIASLKGIASNVEVLAQSAEESSASILEMAQTNDEVVENIGSLSMSVEETTSAIEEMTFSIKEVAKNIEDLSASTEETSSSMNEMDVSIGQVEMNANETSKLAELVSADAASGAAAISKTLTGIERIKDSSRTAAGVIDSLGRKILTIGNILNVIDDVAEQTNLLALNAAIIAAQAGEHGKGFAVVADEIKDLAERTGASTKEIAELVKGVQDESRNAVAAMERGVKSVDEGVKLGTEAEGALKKILESSSKASQMVKAIARATVEQSRGSKQVTNSINRIAETVQQIAKATNEQARGSEQIMKSAEKMKVITKHVERSSQEQARGSKQITRSIENISEMVNQLNRAQKEQTRGSENVLGAMENIKRVADAQHSTMRELERAIEQLAEQSETLRSEVRRFRV
jgi:methyl-accepting chemotaxis protein